MVPVCPTRKLVALLSVALALAASAVGVWWWQSRTVAPVQTVTVERSDLESTVTATGTLQPRRDVDVGAQVSGTILPLHARPGDRVKQDQLLVEIDASVQQAVVDAGRAALADLRAQIARHQTELKHSQALNAKLTHENALLKRMKFAAQSERYNAEQKSLLEDEIEADLAAVAVEIEQLLPLAAAPDAKQQPKRQSLPTEAV